MKALSITDVAEEFGRSADWLRDNWRTLVAEKKLPAPIVEGSHLSWSAAHVYAVLDKKLTPDQRAAAAAFRAAVDAYHEQKLIGTSDREAAEWQQRLQQRFAGRSRG